MKIPSPKLQIPNRKWISCKIWRNEPFNLPKNVGSWLNRLKKSIENIEDGEQLIRSSGSIGANYIEANEKLGDKDLRFRLKIARNEAKESKYWLRLLKESNPDCRQIDGLVNESEELKRILSAIINKMR